MRRLVALLTVLHLFVGGCGSNIELNEQAIIRAIGVDLAPGGKVNVSVRIVVPKLVRLSSSGSGAAQKSGAVFSSTGENFADATANLQKRISRRLLWTHASALVMGEAYARHGIRPTLDFLARHTQTSLELLVVSTKGKAESLIRRDSVVEVDLTEVIERLSKLESMPKVTLKSFLWNLEKQGEEPVTASFDIDPQGGILFDGSAIYRQDRLVRWLSPDETRVLLWFWGQSKEEVITLPVEGARVSLMIQGTRSVRARIKGGRPVVNVQMTVTATMVAGEGNARVESINGQRVIEAAAARYLTQRAERLIAKLQEQGVDALRLAASVERADPRGWAKRATQWPQLFATLPIHVQTDVSLKRTGRMLRQPGRPHPPQGVSE